MPFQHDSAFKLVFSYPELVQSLLELVPDCPASSVTGFERLNCSFVSSSERQRNADMVWRIYCQESVFYLLLEFQSTVDRWASDHDPILREKAQRAQQRLAAAASQ